MEEIVQSTSSIDWNALLEFIMIALFGMSWPVAVYKSYKTKTVGSKSLFFLCIIWTGYIFGITRKLIFDPNGYVLYAYIFNIIFITIDIFLYTRYKKLDKNKMNTGK